MSSDDNKNNDFVIVNQIHAMNLNDITPPVPRQCSQAWSGRGEASKHEFSFIGFC